jgi:hypothetical protein
VIIWGVDHKLPSSLWESLLLLELQRCVFLQLWGRRKLTIMSIDKHHIYSNIFENLIKARNLAELVNDDILYIKINGALIHSERYLRLYENVSPEPILGRHLNARNR